MVHYIWECDILVRLVIKKHRINKGISQEELASRSGVSQAWISKLEANKFDDINPSAHSIYNIAVALDVCVCQLIQCEHTR